MFNQQPQTMRRDVIRLLKNLVALGIIAIIGFFIYQYYFNSKKDELKIEDTPIHIESIKTIAEISTVSYKDEVVVDTVELYKRRSSIYDPREWMRYYDRNIKRRLTLIVKGEVKIGLNLTNGNYSINSNSDTIWLHLPEPKILDVLVAPSKTEIFQEKGTWKDQDRKQLEMKAKLKLKNNAIKLKLIEKSRKSVSYLFSSLIQSEKKLIIDFSYGK